MKISYKKPTVNVTHDSARFKCFSAKIGNKVRMPTLIDPLNMTRNSEFLIIILGK